MNLQELVRAFNALPRTRKTPSGLVEYHWHFAVNHVSLSPPGDLLHIVNPPSRYTHTQGPVQIISLSSVAARVDIILPLLLKAFVTDMGNGHDSRSDPRAPWSWGTEDTDSATALEDAMKAAGVRGDLCTIKTGDRASIQIEKEVWASFEEELNRRTGPKCNNCSSLPERDGPKLLLCAVCKVARYCSRDCQKADWKEHKIVCKVYARDPSIKAVDFYQICSNLPDAKSLAREIGLTLPGEGGASQGLK